MTDKYWVYRPLLDLIGKSEGTDRKRKYNETLAYGALTGGDVDLVSMTLDQVDALQGRMLAHPANKWDSSALGRYQIVRTTMRSIRKTLNLDGRLLYDAAMQDRMACFLLGQRGIDKWLAGRMKRDTLLHQLAQEWASLPKPDGAGAYKNQRAHVTVAEVDRALAEVLRRHKADNRPVDAAPPPPAPQPTTPPAKRDFWTWLGGLFGR